VRCASHASASAAPSRRCWNPAGGWTGPCGLW
jgi:hypothetical protein